MVNELLLAQFGQLVSRAEDVPRLNAAILQLAVQGRLVPQDPADEPARALLARITAEKKRLGIKSPKLWEIGEEERPYALPEGWEWAKLGNIVSFEYGKSLPAKRRDDKGDILVYGSNGVVGYHSEELINQDCVVVGRKGSSGAVNLAPGKSWIIDTAFYILPPQEIDLKFLFRLLQSLKLDQLGKGIKPGLNRNEAYQLITALPPLAEQKRIVERVNTLLAQTRQLEAQLAQAEQALSRLHSAAIQDLLSASDADDFAARWQFIADHFDTLYDEAYPEAALANVAALKQAILQLAVQGKLTHQDPADEPAHALLARITAEKKRLGIKSPKLWEIGEEERPYALPEGWEWAKLVP